MLMILIPGLILVGIMVWASTRIKRHAAEAFERESIETSEFSLTKPEGFLSIADPPDGLLFSAYSKEFGRDDAERIRRATAEVRRIPGVGIDKVVKDARTEAAGIISEQTGVIGGSKCATIVVERLEQGIALERHYKIITGPDSIYQLVIDVLPEHRDEMQPKIDELLSSFSLP